MSAPCSSAPPRASRETTGAPASLHHPDQRVEVDLAGPRFSCRSRPGPGRVLGVVGVHEVDPSDRDRLQPLHDAVELLAAGVRVPGV